MSCVISKSQGLTIDGSNKFAGHVTLNGSFNFSFGDAPSSASVTLVAEDGGGGASGGINLLDTYKVGFGNLEFKMKLMSQSKNTSATNANTLTLEFVDTSVDYLDQYYVALNREQLQSPSPSTFLIGLGEKYGLKKDVDGFGNVSSAGSRAYINLAFDWATRNAAYINAANNAPTAEAAQKIRQMVTPNFQQYIDNADGTALYLADVFFDEVNKSLQGKVPRPDEIDKHTKNIGVENMAIQVDSVGAKEVCPDYMSQFMSQFQDQSEDMVNVVVPVLVIEEKGEFVNYTGTVREVLSAFARDYGLIFYWNPVKEKVEWLDATAGVSTKLAKAQAGLLSGSCSLLSSSEKEDKSQTYVRGAMGQFDAAKDGAETDNKRLGKTTAQLVSFNNFQFMNCQGKQQALALSPPSFAAAATPAAPPGQQSTTGMSRQQALLQQRQATIAQGLAQRAAKNQPGTASNAGFISAMRAAAVSSKFYAAYVLCSMLGEGIKELIDGDKDEEFENQIKTVLEAQNGGQEKDAKGNDKLDVKALVPKFVKAHFFPNEFIKDVYGAASCPAVQESSGKCSDGLSDFDSTNLAIIETLIKRFRKGDDQSPWYNGEDEPPKSGPVTLPQVEYAEDSKKAGKKVQLSFEEALDLINNTNPAIGCVCTTALSKSTRTPIFREMLNLAGQDGQFANQMTVDGVAAWTLALIEKNSAKTIYSKSLDASADQMYQLLKAFGQMGNRYYILKDDFNSNINLKRTSKEVKDAKGRKVKKSRTFDFLLLRESAQNERSYAIPTGARLTGINPYLRADQDNPFKDLFMAMLKMTFGTNPEVGTATSGAITPDEYPSVADFVSGLMEMGKMPTQAGGSSTSLADLFIKFTPTYTLKELEEKRTLAEAACDKLDDDIVMFIYDTQASPSSAQFSDSAGKLVKQVEDGNSQLPNNRNTLFQNAFQAVLNTKCGWNPLALIDIDPSSAIPPTLTLPALSGAENPPSMKLLYAFDRKAQVTQQDGYFKFSSVHFPSKPPKGVAKVEMDLGVTISPESLGYADSTFAKITQDELIGNAYSLYFQTMIADRLDNEVKKRVQVNGEANISYTYRFAATTAAGGGVNFPDLPGPGDGLESLALSVGDIMEINVTIGSRRQQESAARMRNSRVDLIGGSSSVQTIAQNPSAAVLPPGLRALS